MKKYGQKFVKKEFRSKCCALAAPTGVQNISIVQTEGFNPEYFWFSSTDESEGL
jgi:hypothetical protein